MPKKRTVRPAKKPAKWLAFWQGLDHQRKGFYCSGALHVLLLLFMIFGLPELWESHREKLPQVMTVEVLPIGQTNVKPQEQSPETKKPEPPKKQTAPKPTTKAAPKPTPTPKKEAPKPPKPKVAPPKPEPVKPKPEPAPKPKQEKKPKPEPKKEAPKPEPKKVEKKPEPKKEQAEEEPSLDAILAGIANPDQEEGEKSEPKPANTQKAISDTYNPSLPMAVSEIDAIRSQIAKCWNVPAGAKDAHNLKVTIEVKLAQDGKVLDAQVGGDRSRYGDPIYRAAADSARRAVLKCSPLQNLPADKYDTWRDMELTFDPSDMLF